MAMWQELSVFLPAYNEEANLADTAAKSIKVLRQQVKTWELIIVDDGSRDKTGVIADHLAKKYKEVRVIHHSSNRGYGAALTSGFYAAKYSWIAFIDTDGQFDLAEISKYFTLQHATKADLIIGYYLKRQVPPMTIITSKAWELLIFLLFGLRVRDVDCGFKLVSKKVIDTIPHLEAQRGAFISSELLIKARKSGFKIVEIGVHHYPRRQGQPTGRNINVIIKSFSDVIKLWWKLK
jgi:glycosyltransferase involved in cell wall biosynthesis